MQDTPLYTHYLVVHPSHLCLCHMDYRPRSDLVTDPIQVEPLHERTCIGELVILKTAPYVTTA